MTLDSIGTPLGCSIAVLWCDWSNSDRQEPRNLRLDIASLTLSICTTVLQMERIFHDINSPTNLRMVISDRRRKISWDVIPESAPASARRRLRAKRPRDWYGRGVAYRIQRMKLECSLRFDYNSRRSPCHVLRIPKISKPLLLFFSLPMYVPQLGARRPRCGNE